MFRFNSSLSFWFRPHSLHPVSFTGELQDVLALWALQVNVIHWNKVQAFRKYRSTGGLAATVIRDVLLDALSDPG